MPETYRVIILPEIFDDLIEICSYIEKDSPQNAASVAQELINAIDSLELLPHRFKIHLHRNDPSKTVRSMPVPPFIVYYRVDNLRHSVRILSIYHGARQQPRSFE